MPSDAGATLVLVDPQQPARVYAGGETTLYRSDDAGRTWAPAAAGLPDGGPVAVALDPREPSRLYAATATGALYASDDGATTWQPLPGTGTDAAT